MTTWLHLVQNTVNISKQKSSVLWSTRPYRLTHSSIGTFRSRESIICVLEPANLSTLIFLKSLKNYFVRLFVWKLPSVILDIFTICTIYDNVSKLFNSRLDFKICSRKITELLCSSKRCYIPYTFQDSHGEYNKLTEHTVNYHFNTELQFLQ